MADIDYNRSTKSSRPGQLPWVIAGLLSAFLAGMIGSPWLESRVRAALPVSLRPKEHADLDTTLMARAAALESRLQALEARPLGNDAADLTAKVAALEAHQQSDTSGAAKVANDLGPLGQRVDTLELRLTTAEQAAHAATSAAAQIPSLQNQVLAMSTAVTQLALHQRALASLPLLRRALENGQPIESYLALIAPMLTPNNPDLVQLRQLTPVPTLATLQNDLSRLGRTTGGALSTSASAWLENAMSTVRNLVQVKRGDAVNQPSEGNNPVQDAQGRLRLGDVDGAVILIKQSTPSDQQRLWLQAAARFQLARKTLGHLEAVVIDASLEASH